MGQGVEAHPALRQPCPRPGMMLSEATHLRPGQGWRRIFRGCLRPSSLDYDRLARVVDGLTAVVDSLALHRTDGEDDG